MLKTAVQGVESSEKPHKCRRFNRARVANTPRFSLFLGYFSGLTLSFTSLHDIIPFSPLSFSRADIINRYDNNSRDVDLPPFSHSNRTTCCKPADANAHISKEKNKTRVKFNLEVV